MDITPDSVEMFSIGSVTINATIFFTWVVMALLAGVSWLITRELSSGTDISHGQNALEVIVSFIRDQIREISGQEPRRLLPFIGTLFLYIIVSNVLSIVPGFNPPTGSLSTTAALAVCVFFAVPVFGITEKGIAGYLKNYIRPTPFMLPFQVIGEVSRTLALAVRLFGNVMSGSIIVAVLLAITPLFFPIVMQALGLLTGVIQAYIFAILATVYIASGMRVAQEREKKTGQEQSENSEKGETENG